MNSFPEQRMHNSMSVYNATCCRNDKEGKTSWEYNFIFLFFVETFNNIKCVKQSVVIVNVASFMYILFAWNENISRWTSMLKPTCSLSWYITVAYYKKSAKNLSLHFLCNKKFWPLLMVNTIVQVRHGSQC